VVVDGMECGLEAGKRGGAEGLRDAQDTDGLGGHHAAEGGSSGRTRGLLCDGFKCDEIEISGMN
jgi:hypothetical protein